MEASIVERAVEMDLSDLQMDNGVEVRNEINSEQVTNHIMQYIDFARNLTRQFIRECKCWGCEFEDLEGAAMLGLCSAAQRYNEGCGVDFKCFAYYRIRGAIIDFYRKSMGVKRSQYYVWRDYLRDKESREQKERLEEYNVDSDCKDYNDNASNLVDDEENDKFIPVTSIEDLRYIREVAYAVGLQIHISPAAKTVELSYANEANPEAAAALAVTSSYLKKVISRLTDEERAVIEYKYYENLDYEDICNVVHSPSRSWISRTHRRALGRLRDKISADHNLYSRMQYSDIHFSC